MALLGGDTEAKRALTDAIANLAEQTSGLLPSRLEEAWQRTRIELEDLAAERRYSVRLFNQLAQIEHNAGPLVEKYQPGAEHDVLGAAPVDLDSVNAATAAEVVRTITEELLAGGPATDMLQAGQPALERSAELEKIATIRAALLSSHPKFTTGEPLPVPWATAAALLTALERAAALARLLPLEIRATADELRGLPTAVRDHALQTLKDVLARATSVDPADRTAFTARDPLSV